MAHRFSRQIRIGAVGAAALVGALALGGAAAKPAAGNASEASPWACVSALCTAPGAPERLSDGYKQCFRAAAGRPGPRRACAAAEEARHLAEARRQWAGIDYAADNPDRRQFGLWEARRDRVCEAVAEDFGRGAEDRRAVRAECRMYLTLDWAHTLEVFR
jgi:hypothetical protein